MKHTRRILSLLLCLVLGMTMVSSIYAEERLPKIGLVQLLEHPALDQAREGFLKGLLDGGYKEGENILIDYRNAQGSQDVLAGIGDHFVAEEVDLIVAIATPAVQTMAAKTQTIPILGTAVTDYQIAGLVKENEHPGYNVSGTTDMNPIADQIKLIRRLCPDTKTVGILYTGSETNSVLQAEIAREIIKQEGMKPIEVTVINSNDVQQATQSLVGACDAVYLPTDNVMAATMALISDIMTAAKVPLFCGERGMVEGGGTATLGIDYYKLGIQTGQMAIDVLKGADVSTMPIQAQTNFEYMLNKTSLEALSISVPEDLLPYVQEGTNPTVEE